jgi:HipA-like protein
MAIRKFFEAAREWLGMRKAVHAPPDVRARFLLTYGDLLIGTLSVQDGIWRFEYSDEFRRSDLRPIVEFPDVNNSYENQDLWQFFASRIPSTEQVEIEEILRRENIAEDDAVGLLRRFGTRTINNPFELRAA